MSGKRNGFVVPRKNAAGNAPATAAAKPGGKPAGAVGGAVGQAAQPSKTEALCAAGGCQQIKGGQRAQRAFKVLYTQHSHKKRKNQEFQGVLCG